MAARLGEPYEVTLEFIGAKLVGRWKDGSSLIRNTYHPYPRQQAEREERRRRRDTAEGFSPEDAICATGERLDSGTVPGDPACRQQADLRCGAGGGKRRQRLCLRAGGPARGAPSVRRADPRDSFEPDSSEQVSISNRHRILRVERLYQQGPGDKPGLLFMGLSGDIERQFEFTQQTWLLSPAFHGLVGEQDPVTGNNAVPPSGFVMPTPSGPIRLKPLPQFVRTLGDGYFFVPSRSFLRFLGRPAPADPARHRMVNVSFVPRSGLYVLLTDCAQGADIPMASASSPCSDLSAVPSCSGITGTRI